MLYNGLISALNGIISGFGSILTTIVALLPGSPFTILMDSPVAHMYGWLNWIIPVSTILATMQVWLLAVAGFYVYSIALRWVKAL